MKAYGFFYRKNKVVYINKQGALMFGASGNGYNWSKLAELTAGSTSKDKEEVKVNKQSKVSKEFESIELDSMKPKKSSEENTSAKMSGSKKDASFFKPEPSHNHSDAVSFLNRFALRF